VVSYSWKNERYNVSFGCNNLFDKELYDNFMLQKPGRSFFAKFRIFIN
jgi:outer membrane receptor protein involved in Fe transport